MTDFQKLDEAGFKSLIASSKKPVLVEFGAPWCKPCKFLEPELLKLGQEQNGRLLLAMIDVDQCPDLLMGLNIMGVPTVILFVGGKEVQRTTGFLSLDKLKSRFQLS